MNKFFKFLISLLSIFGTVIAALAIFDKFSNKNRIDGDYLDCDIAEDYENSDE